MSKQIEIKDQEVVDEDPLLVKEVDQMMDPEIPDEPVNPIDEVVNDEDSKPLAETADNSSLPPIDIFQGTQTAPLFKKTKEKESTEIVADGTNDDVRLSEAKDDLVDNELKEQNEDSDFVASVPLVANDYSDPQTSKAIEDIMAHESDEVLAVEDSKFQQSENHASQSDGKSSKGHMLFWLMVFIICVIAVGLAAYIVNPKYYKSITKINWSSIEHHL